MPQSITVKPIEAKTKGELNQLRKSGWIPVNIQHRGEETVHAQVERRLIEDFIHKHGVSAIMEPMLEKTGRRERMQIHDLQRDPVHGQILLVTFQKILRGEKVKSHVPIRLVGTPEPVREHIGVIQQPLEYVDVECDPQFQPEHLDVDISRLDFHTVARVSDLPHDPNYKILTPDDTVVASVTTLATRDVRAEEEAAAAEAAAAEATAVGEPAAEELEAAA